MRLSQRDISPIGLLLLIALIWLAVTALTPTASSHDGGPEIQTGRMAPAVVSERLIAFEGYSEVKRIELVGDTYMIEAVKNGHAVNLTMNSLTGVDNISSLYMPNVAR